MGTLLLLALTAAADADTRMLSRPAGDPAITSLAYTRDGRTVVTGDAAGGVRRWDAATGRPVGPTVRVADAPPAGGVHPEVAPGGRFAVTTRPYSGGRVFDLAVGKEVARLPAPFPAD